MIEPDPLKPVAPKPGAPRQVLRYTPHGGGPPSPPPMFGKYGPDRKPWTLLGAMASVAIGFACAIPLGFWMNEKFPKMPDWMMASLVIGTLVGISFGLTFAMMRLMRAAKPTAGIGGGPMAEMRFDGEAAAGDVAQRTGYEMTFPDFCRMICEKWTRESASRLLREWHRMEIEGEGAETVVWSFDGAKVDLAVLYQMVQSDREKQYTIYQKAMDVWR